MTSKFPRRVAVTFPAGQMIPILAVCEKLKALTGCEMYLYVNGSEAVRNMTRRISEGLFADIINCSAPFDRAFHAEDLDADEVFARARSIEQFLGCTFNELIMCRRDTGLAFSLGGFRHPRSRRSEHATYVEVVHAFSEVIEFWRVEFITKKIGLVINGPKEVSVLARAMGIPQRILGGARYQNRYLWARDEFFEYPEIQEVFKTEYDPNLLPAKLDQPYFFDIKFRARMFGQGPLVRSARAVWKQTLRWLYLNYKGFNRQSNYYLLEQWKLVWRRERELAEVTVPLAQPSEVLKGRKFVYFPLHVEPELSLHGLSPEYFFQLGAIGSIARDLPAGVWLVVKENMYGVGRRPRDFYDQIKSFKNIIFLDARERGLDIVKQADVVVTITGTAGVEAAILGKPVVTFGRHVSYDFLDHVTLVTREEELRPALARALGAPWDAQRARCDGANFLRAIVAVSFDMETFDQMNHQTATQGGAENACQALIESVVKQSISVGK